MIGTLRLLLAAMVATSHTIPSPPQFQLGVPAVIVFFLLSGYAMRVELISKRFPRPEMARSFYLERFIHLAPPILLLAGSRSLCVIRAEVVAGEP